jgi:hypothetical protein
MVRSILAVLLIAVFAVGASAYDFLYTGDTAMTHDAGGFGVSGGLMYLMADEYYDHDGEAQEIGGDWTAMWIPINVYYAAMDNLEFGVSAKFGMLDLEESSSSRDDPETYEGSGLGDTWLWAKYMFMPDPMVTARVGFFMPTGNEPFHPAFYATGFYGVDEDMDIATGKGEMAIDGAILFGVPAGPGQFDAAVGYRYFMAREITMEMFREEVTFDYTCGNQIHFAAGYTYFIGDAMSFTVAADGFFGSEDEVTVDDESATVDDSAANAVWINPAFDYMMENGLTIGVDGHWMIMGQNAPIEKGIGLYLGWGM